MSIRSSGYCAEEDMLIRQVHLDISLDSITGVYQSLDRFWSHVKNAYNKVRHEHWEYRNKRSMQYRIQTIEKATSKLNVCLKQVENMYPSNAQIKIL